MPATLDPIQASEAAFARSLGFHSFDDLLEASEPLLSPDGELWFIVELSNGRWLSWPFPEYDDTHQFASYDEAMDFVRPMALV
jgi:hypothetical protein